MCGQASIGTGPRDPRGFLTERPGRVARGQTTWKPRKARRRPGRPGNSSASCAAVFILALNTRSTVADCAGDVRAICAELGIDRLAMWGISGGGPHVLACAALLPDLVTAAASLASLARFDAEGLDYFAGMGQDNVDDTRPFLTDEAAARAKTDKDREEMLATSPADAASGIESLLTPTDAAVLNGELAEYLVSSSQDGLAPGSQGWWEDNCMIRPWGFDLAGITVPVLLLHGRQDRFVPFGHGEWLAAHIPGVEARLLDDDGHLTLLRNRIPEVHAWLSEHL
jgi:pimeloyl-ACP methyl ester carboxylesterase